MIPSMLDLCPECRGEGIDRSERKQMECESCGGVGRLDRVKCDVCEGSGKECSYCGEKGVLEDVMCPDCNGLGEVEVPVVCDRCHGQKTVIPAELFELEA